MPKAIGRYSTGLSFSTIIFPKEFFGKRIRFKIEILEDKKNENKNNIQTENQDKNINHEG